MDLVRSLRYDSPPHLPPPTIAPILEYYDPDIKRVIPERQLEAPVDDRGVVKIFDTVKLAMGLADPEYTWPREEPRPDEHHFVWERDWYHPRHFGGSRIPRDYRNIPFHMGYLPRQLHDFIHATIAPPPVPDFEVMRYRTESHRVALELFKACSLAVRVHRKPETLHGIERLETGELSITDEILREVLVSMTSRVVHRKELILPENEFIDETVVNERSLSEVARSLGKVAALSAVNMMPVVYGNKAIRTAA